MADHRINTSLSPTEQQALFDGVNTSRNKLPFIIDLTVEERRFLPGMGESTVQAVF